MAYVWSQTLETGHHMIDTQHKQLIEAINSLLAACQSGQGKTKVHDTVKFLYDYTDKHFSDEEVLQKKFGYPDYINHHKLHEGFKSAVKKLGERLDTEGPGIGVVSAINTQVGDWLINHIKKEDVKVAAHLKSKGG